MLQSLTPPKAKLAARRYVMPAAAAAADADNIQKNALYECVRMHVGTRSRFDSMRARMLRIWVHKCLRDAYI